MAGWTDAMYGSRREDRGSGIPLKNHKNIGFSSNTGPDPLKNRSLTKPAFSVGPSAKRHLMAFCWQRIMARL